MGEGENSVVIGCFIKWKIVEHQKVFLRFSVKMPKYLLGLFYFPLIKTPTENGDC